jgi:hypothetical protein
MHERTTLTNPGVHKPHKPILHLLPDTPNTRRLARAMLVATIRYNLLARPPEDSAPSA